ncbi:MAG: hypothetical protein ACKV22_14685 [Bryobacteraceae bacterium]
MEATLRGSFWAIYLYDVAHAIDLERLRVVLGAGESRRVGFRHPAPEYAGFEKAPVFEVLEPIALESGERLNRQANYYEYGVVSVKLELPFELGWPEMVERSSRWMASAELERRAGQTLTDILQQVAAALATPYAQRLSEDYYVIQLQRSDQSLTAAELIRERGEVIGQMVRGETVPLSPEECTEVLAARMSYYANDVAIVGWTAAVVYDSAEGAEATIQLLEYANLQLLEFRHYDGKLTELLAGAYDLLEKKKSFLSRWRMAREAERINAIRLDLSELTERMDASIKFLSDMFSARFYRMAAARVGVRDYRDAVEEKLRTAGNLYGYMMDEFHQGRAFVLELTIVIILFIDLYFLFRGKS